MNTVTLEKFGTPYDRKKLSNHFKKINSFVQKDPKCQSIAFRLKKQSFSKRKCAAYGLQKGGHCGANSVEFISKHFKGLKKGKSSLKAVYATSKKFTEGNSAKTARINELGNRALLYKASRSLSKKKQDLLKYRIIGHLYGIGFKKIFEKSMKNPDTRTKKIQSLTKHLKKGAYLIKLTPLKSSNKPQHAIAYVKGKKNSFLFDSNFGTFAILKGLDAAALSECIRFYKTERKIQFLQASPN